MTKAPGLPGRQGNIVWAISPFNARDPFRVIEHDGSERRYPSANDLSRAIVKRELAPELDLAIGAKLRPVLLLQDRPTGRFEDFAALQLTRVEKFAPADQATIRGGGEVTLFHLGHDKAKYGLDKEYAVLLGSLHRIHVSAIAGKPVGSVDEAEFRTVCERLVRVLDLDISNLVVREAGALTRRLRDAKR